VYYDDDEYDPEDEYEYDFDRQLNECGYDPEFVGKCWDAGTEWCSFHCPLHSSIFHGGSDDVDIPF
jgi:hypothetical protein